jgi:hypothetical protein
MICASVPDPLIRAVTIVTECPSRKTYCHDNFGYLARKPLIRFGVFRERRGPLFALKFGVTYTPGLVVVDTNGAGKG